MTHRRIAIVGSRQFGNFAQLDREVRKYILSDDDEIVSGGAVGADSMGQRWAKENGHDISIKYPKYGVFGKSATFIRNEKIVAAADVVLAFYARGRFGIGGTRNAIEWGIKLGKEYHEFEEEE